MGEVAANAALAEQRTSLAKTSLVLPLALVLAAGGGVGYYGYAHGWFAQQPVLTPAAKKNAADAGTTEVAAANPAALDEAQRRARDRL